MKNCFKVLFIGCILFFNNAYCQVLDTINPTVQNYKVSPTVTYGFKKPTFGQMFKYIPEDVYNLGKFFIQKENLKWTGLAVGTTAALIPFDQKILDNSNLLGEKIGGWEKDSKYIRIAGLEFVPTSISSGVYYLGNGNTTLLLSGMFYAIGKIGKDDYRALNTSNELVEVLLSVGVVTQTIKRISGRQSPAPAIRDGNPGGDWNPFPSFSAYARDTPNYDAMPSGHIATFMATLTVIATNYPEKKWIKPVGYSLGGLLAFNMMSGRVHWVSDYPIAILVGYVMGKNIANRRIIKSSTVSDLDPKKTKYKTNYNYTTINNTSVVGATITF